MIIRIRNESLLASYCCPTCRMCRMCVLAHMFTYNILYCIIFVLYKKPLGTGVPPQCVLLGPLEPSMVLSRESFRDFWRPRGILKPRGCTSRGHKVQGGPQVPRKAALVPVETCSPLGTPGPPRTSKDLRDCMGLKTVTVVP